MDAKCAEVLAAILRQKIRAVTSLLVGRDFVPIVSLEGSQTDMVKHVVVPEKTYASRNFRLSKENDFGCEILFFGKKVNV
jgi:hypothetical protein